LIISCAFCAPLWRESFWAKPTKAEGWLKLFSLTFEAKPLLFEGRHPRLSVA
jgi:hypothetical protein